MKLNLRVDKEIDSEGPPPTVFATIYAIDPDSGRKRQGQAVQRELIPISHHSGDTRAVELSPGHYVVEVALPSGEILSDSIDVSAENEVELALNAQESPHEWLSWQHLMGNVSSVPATASKVSAAASRPPTRARKSTRKKKGGSGSAGTPAHRRIRRLQPETSEGLAGATTPVVLPTLLHWLSSPMPGLVGGPNVDAWTALAQLPSGGPPLSQLLNGGNPPQLIPIYTEDPEVVIYRVVHGPGGVSGATPLGGALPRDFIALPEGNTVELLSLPMPWQVIPSGREAVVEIIVRQRRNVNDFATSMTVRDERLGVLLGYLSSGALGAVKEIADSALDMLYHKTMNPLAAAAGAYAMVGTATDTNEHEWHGWIKNLCNWFPHIPDGAIQQAQLHLRLRRGSEDFAQAAQWLKQAYRRGLPFYTLGVRWLLDGLEKVARSDPEAEEMRKAVQALAWRIHPQSPFTILQLGGG